MKRNKSTSNDDYFDDCPLCQLMKKAEEEGKVITISDYKQVLKEAKKKGAVVGGPLVEEIEEEEWKVNECLVQ